MYEEETDRGRSHHQRGIYCSWNGYHHRANRAHFNYFLMEKVIFFLSKWAESYRSLSTPQPLYNTIAGIKRKTVLAKQLYCIQTKVY